MVQLFLLAAAAHHVTMATAETTEREMIRELILLYLSSLNYTPLYQQRADKSMMSFTVIPTIDPMTYNKMMLYFVVWKKNLTDEFNQGSNLIGKSL